MGRRRRVVLSSAVLLLAVVLALVLVTGVGMRSEYGQERVRRFLSAWLNARASGTMYVGRVRGGFFDGVTVDSIEIRDDRGQLFVASGPAKVRYDLRDLFDQRVVLRHLELTRPVVQIRQYSDGTWNFKRIFPAGQPAPIGRRRGFADFITFDSASVSSGHATLILPWYPPDGASATAAARRLAEDLADPSGHIVNTAHGPVRLFRFNELNARFGRGRLAHPDTAGRVVQVLDLSVDSRDPPFAFSSVVGAVRHHGDSVWFDASRWMLPGSEGTGRGKITWGGGRPTRFAIHVDAPRASLADIAWVHPTFPRQGGGSGKVDIRNAAHDEGVIEFALSDLDIRSHGSQVTGRMTVDPSDDLLKVRNLSVRLAPLDFELLRVLNGEPFPYDWRGRFTGTVEASGGPVNRFRVERADLTFTDAHVPGAVSSGVASGVIDILDPGLTVFHGLALNVARLDLRTPRAVIREFPELDGHVSGTATLDSIWTDVRFREANLVHRDGDSPPSQVTGSGRITFGDPYLTYDVTLNATQLSFTTLAKSYPALPLRGEFSGPLRVLGEAPRLRLVTNLEGPGGVFAFDGIVDADAPAFGAEGSGTFARADVRQLLHGDAPRSALNGRYAISLSGADATSSAGTFDVSLDESQLGDVPIESAVARGRLGAGIMHLDTAALVSSAAVIGGAGGLAFAADTSAVFRFTAAVDSLRAFSSLVARTQDDSVPRMSGRLFTTAELRTGGGEAVGLEGELTGSSLVVGSHRADQLSATFDLSRVGRDFLGDFSLTADTVAAGALRLARAETGGSLALARDTSIVWLDSLVARVNDDHAYRTTARSTIRLAAGGFALDSLVLAPVRGRGSLAVRDLLWSEDSLAGSIRSRDADLGMLGGVVPGVREASGPVTMALDLGGTRAQPRSRGSLQLRGGMLATTNGRYEQVTADVELQDTRLIMRELSAVTQRGGARRGTARVNGTVDIADATDPFFDIHAEARSFRAVNRRGVALLDVSTGPPLHLTGPASAATLRGSLIVDEGTIFLPERLDKEITDISDPELLALVDTALSAGRRFLPGAPSAFVSNLELDEVRIVLGEDVWLRSSEANVELGGSLLVTRARAPDGVTSQLGLVGALNATRGTYVLNLGIVQPTFQVERGTLRFFGSPEVNPRLDIRAIHTVRQPRRTLAREDIRILVALTGTLRDPELSLSSADSLPLSQSDLLSYLVTGEPAFALTGSSTEYAEQLLTLGGRLAGTIISARIPRTLFDIVEVRTGAVRLGSGSGTSPSYLNTLYDTRVILGKQLSDRWYLGLSTGLCRANFAENLGLRLEYRFSSTYFAQGGIEPGSGDLSCVGPTTARAFQQTPPQLGADVFRSWRF